MAGSVIQYFRNHDSSDNTYVLQGSAALQSPESLGFSAPEGKIFDSWNTSRDGSGTTFYPGGWAEVPSLYAIWVVDAVDSDVAITYNGSVIAGLSITGSKTLNTAGKYCSGSIVVSYTKPALQSKTVTPTTSVQNVTPDSSVYGLGQVTVNAIPSAYIIPSGTSVVTSNSVYDITAYASVSVNVQPTLQSKTVTPTENVQTVTPDANIYGLSRVTVNAIPSAYIIPSGTITLSESGTFDVTSYASADVTVTGGPSGMYVEYDGVYVKNVDLNSATSIPGMLLYSHSMSSTFSFTNYSAVTNIGFSAFCFAKNNRAGVGAIDLDFPNLSFIGNSAFYQCDWVKTFSASRLTSAVSNAFRGCTYLSSVSVPALSSFPDYLFAGTGLTEASFSIESIGRGVFIQCLSLVSASFSNCTLIRSEAFSGCVSLTDTYFPNVEMMYGATFQACTWLSEIDLPKLKSICSSAANTAGNGGNFSGCIRLKEISAPVLASVLGPGTFRNCSSLTSVYFPELTTISGTSAFYMCNNLVSINAPRLSNIIGSCIFAYCSALPSMSFPLLSSSGSVYMSYWFSDCRGLSLVSFKNIKRIYGLGAFSRCFNLVSLFMMGSSLTELGNTIASMFSSTPVSTYSTSAGRWASIFVPSSLLASYKAATNWTTVSSKIFAYEDYFDAEGNPK